MPLITSVILAFVPALFYSWLTYWTDRYEKEPLHLIGGVFLWGAIVAAGGAYILNTIFGIAIFTFTADEIISDLATGSLSAPLVEEGLKGFAVLIIFLIFRKEFDSVLDGIVYAAITALGFAATENVVYMMQFGFAEEGWGGLGSIFFLRVVLGAWNHATYTAFIGIGLAIARNTRNTLVKLVALLVGFSTAVFTHFFHNTLAVFALDESGLLMLLFVDWLGWLFITAIILWAIRRERFWLQVQLKGEMEVGLISNVQYETAQSPFKRGIATLAALGGGRYRTTKRFYQTCAELAYKKQQIAYVGISSSNTPEMVEELRAKLKRLAPMANA
jgi:RsiW-degrading membrane proteinase PrsW (M82 family)